ncbi:MAG: VWA domain-containing protein [Deltaproteobacteria bacterium]|nr:VWA domain-containing protein [Deltaproteobacteria bacterium]MBN2670177.1 VWA domain-containing protein [Deltaproteobacteria bacterium]
MRFAEPNLLFFLIAPALAIVFFIVGIWLRKRLISRLGTGKVVEAQLRRPSPYLRAAKSILLVLGLALLVFATARPQYGGRVQQLKKRGIDVVVALDFSKSMLAQDVRPNRLERAKLELAGFIKKLTGDRIGLVAFAGDTMRFPLTTDYTAAVTFWKDLTPYDMPVGGTAIGKALNAANAMLFDNRDEDDVSKALKSRSKVIILLTDGEDHIGTPVDVSKEIAKNGVKVFTVGIGSDSPELIPRYLDDGTAMGYQKDNNGEYITTSLSAENEDTLKQIAANTQGRYFRAGSDLSGLQAVVDEIRNMKQSEVESRKTVLYDEVFQWFLLPAILFLLLAFLLPDRRVK